MTDKPITRLQAAKRARTAARAVEAAAIKADNAARAACEAANDAYNAAAMAAMEAERYLESLAEH